MDKPKFSIKQSDKFWWKIKVPYITDDGEEQPITIRLRFKRLKYPEWQKVIEDASERVATAIQERLKALTEDEEESEKITMPYVLRTQFDQDKAVLAIYADALKQVVVEFDEDTIDAPEGTDIDELVEGFCNYLYVAKAIFDEYAHATTQGKRADGLKK